MAMLKLSTLVLFLGTALAFRISPEENKDNPSLFEGDIDLSPGQKFAIDNNLDLGSVATTRGASRSGRWTNNVVPYTINSALASDSRASGAINAAIRDWSEKTCLKFVRRTSQRSYIEFTTGSGCSSPVGMRGGRQQIKLASGCWRKGTVIHEIGHSLGFWHEQSRPDRDNYVTIMWQNIKSQNKHNFNKYSNSKINSLNIPYDYESIMHYGSKAFTNNGQPTIVPKRSGVTIGQRNGLSTSDVRQMNLMYRCGNCVDKNSRCPQWKDRYCSNHRWVRDNCKKTCNLC